MKVNPKHQELSEAILIGDFETVQRLVKGGLDLKQPWTFYPYPIQALLDSNHANIARFLCDKGLPIYANALDLIESGIKVQLCMPFGAWEKANHDVLMVMLEYIEDINNSNPTYNPLCRMSEIENESIGIKSDEYFQRILEKGVDPDLPEIDDDGHYSGKTMLHWAVMGNNKYVISIIESSKEIDACPSDHPDQTPLRKAVSYASDNAVKALIDKGANYNIYRKKRRLNKSRSLLDFARDYYDDAKKEMFQEEKAAKYKQIVELLEEAGAKTFKQMVFDGDIPGVSKEEWID